MPTNRMDLASLIAFAARNRFAVLLATLTVFILIAPLISTIALSAGLLSSRMVVGVSFTLVLVAAVFAVAHSRRIIWIALLLGIPAILLEGADVGIDAAYGVEPSFAPQATQLTGHGMSILFLGFAIIVLLKMLFVMDRVTWDTISAALCIYLLLAVMWGMVYSVVANLDSRAFAYNLAEVDAMNAKGGPRSNGFADQTTGLATYFSFVTMTTLGYGDIVPRSSVARTLAMVQAVAGQFYLTVLVARLVGLHTAHSDRRRAPNDASSSLSSPSLASQRLPGGLAPFPFFGASSPGSSSRRLAISRSFSSNPFLSRAIFARSTEISISALRSLSRHSCWTVFRFSRSCLTNSS
jgi:hypothetical protein